MTTLTRRALIGGLLACALSAPARAMPFQRLGVRANGLKFPLLRWGDEASPTVMMLHGFPQEPMTWQPVAEGLAGAGFQVIAPWLRGYAASNRAEPYLLAQFSTDVTAIADALGVVRFDVVGAGVGGALAWVLAANNPGRVRSAASLLFPHPAAFAAAMGETSEQRQKWQALQESLGAGDPQGQAAQLLAHHAAGLTQVLTGAGVPPSFLKRYLANMRQRGALAAALSWNNALSLEQCAAVPPVSVPSLLLWSEGPGLSRKAADASRAQVRGWFMEQEIPEGGHFMLENAPGAVTRALLSWLEAQGEPRRAQTT